MDFSPVWPVIWEGKNSPCFYIFIFFFFFSDVILRKQSAHAMDLSLAVTLDVRQHVELWGTRGLLQWGSQSSEEVWAPSECLSHCFEMSGVADGQACPKTLGGLLVCGHLLISNSWVSTR